MSFSIEEYIKQKRSIVDSALHQTFLIRRNCPKTLWESMQYSVFAGGKRLRPILCLATAEVVGLPLAYALRLACALEMVHTYSLIHDDLPDLDNDDYRRGRKTNHKVYGNAMAILAGDALLTRAFEWVSNPYIYPVKYQKNLPMVIMQLAYAAGYSGMVGGQVDDILSEKKKATLTKVVSIHKRKTGALLRTSVLLPAYLAGIKYEKFAALYMYGNCAGLAFQIVDDILNETGTRKRLGKSAGSDRVMGKMTYPAAIGLERSKREVKRLTERAVNALKIFGAKGRPLAVLAEHMAERTY